MVKNVNISNGLHDGERYGEHTSPLIDFTTTSFTILGKLFEAWNGFTEKLEDDRRGDVWRKPHQDNGEGGKATT